MKRPTVFRTVLIITLLLCGVVLYAQQAREHIRLYPIPEVSQKTNAFLHRIGSFVFISSVDGLNILQGQNMRVLRSGRDGLYDSNVQSDFFHDGDDRVWFCTFTGFYYYNLRTGRVTSFRVTDHNGDTLRSEYRIAALVGDHLFIQNGEELVGFDIHRQVVAQRWCLGPCILCDFSIHEASNGFHVVAGKLVGAEAMFLSLQNTITDRVGLIPGHVTAIEQAGGSVWVAGGDSTLHQVLDGRVVDDLRLSDRPKSLSVHENDLLINYGSYFTRLHTRTRMQSTPIRVYENRDLLTDVWDLQIDHDSILWVSAEGAGVFSANLKLAFSDFLNEPYTAAPPVTTIISRPDHHKRFVLFTTNRGVVVLDSNGTPLVEHLTDQHDQLLDTRNAILLDDDFLFYSQGQDVVRLLDFMDGTTRTLRDPAMASGPGFYHFRKVGRNLLVGSTHSNGMGTIQVHKRTLSYTFEPFATSMDIGKSYTYFLSDRNHHIYASYNEEVIHVYTPVGDDGYQFKTAVPIPGGVWGLNHFPGDSVVYVGNTRGLFRIHTNDYSWQDLNQSAHLPVSIHCITGDTLGRLWISTNGGILKYTPASGQTELFTREDGVSSKEFMTHSSYQDSLGRIYFGGTEGVTVFNPYRVSPSKRAAPVNVFGFNINDNPSDKFRDGLTDSLSMPYHERTLSFEFQAVDYTAAAATRVRYKMSYYDQDWVTSTSSRGIARYADMRPGQYTFSLQGMNADGILNEAIRVIHIRIIPPFYMTWWFRLLVVLATLGLVYLAIRIYYRRKLERKDMQLKEQSLQIEKQTAVERERNRIAAEMHDDLGAGLTRIKFLSERALKHTRDAGKAEEIQRIADQSNRLVTNMSEIIWAMNSRFDTMESLAGYIRHYASEYLEEHQIDLHFRFEPGNTNPVVTAERRRNIFLVVKELLHNTVKYSGTNAVEMQMTCEANVCTLIITEKDVAGFDPDALIENGNGLYNMRKRMSGIGGQIYFEHNNGNMIFTLLVPISNT